MDVGLFGSDSFEQNDHLEHSFLESKRNRWCGRSIKIYVHRMFIIVYSLCVWMDISPIG